MWWWESMFGGCPGGGGMLFWVGFFFITNGWQVITEKLTTYYSIKTSNTQGWKLAGVQLPKAPKNLGGLLEIEVYFSYWNVVMGIDVRWVSRGRRDVVLVCFFFITNGWQVITFSIYVYYKISFQPKMVHFTSGSYFGPCEKTFFRSFKKSKTR
jgi:hypothetical protein